VAESLAGTRPAPAPEVAMTSVALHLVGHWHDDDTAEAFEPNGAGGHNAVIHT
jgi:hypothetical protein